MAAETLYCCKKHGQTRSNVTPNLQASSLLLGWDCVGSTTNNGYKIPYWAVNMNVREFEMRMQLANLQERYREKQRELAMLRCSQKAEKRHTAKSSDFAHSHTKRSSQVPPLIFFEIYLFSLFVRIFQSHRSISSSYSMIRRQRSMSLCSAERTGEKRELKMKISIEKTTLSTDVSTACSKAPKSVEKRSHTGMSFINLLLRVDSQFQTFSAIRISKLSKDKLIDGARLLYLENGLLYPGTLQVIEPPDVYGLEFDGVGGPEPHILCEEELLEKGV